MFVKIKNTRINLDNVSKYFGRYDTGANRYILWVEYLDEETSSLIGVDTAEELDIVLSELDKITKPIDIKTIKE